MEQKSIKDMSTAEMVAEYNQLTGKSIKKFSDRKTGEAQLQKARTASTDASAQTTPEKEKKIMNETKKPIQEKRSIAASNSWNDKEIAARRSKRNSVKVEGQEEVFYSVKSAFEKLGLDLKRHIQFRGLLKANGKATYSEGENENKKEFNFHLVELEEHQKFKALNKPKGKKAIESQPETLAA